jgi:hypothetical protein
MMHNAEQIFKIFTTAFGDSLLVDGFDSHDCSKLSSSADMLACEWHALARTRQSDSFEWPASEEWEGQILKVYRIMIYTE